MSQKEPKAFSLAEALITLLIVAIITLATIPVITKKHRSKNTEKHGMYACYWNGNTLVARQMINGDKTPGTTQYDPQEGRQGCVFNPPPGAKNFVVTVVGGGGGGAGSGSMINDSSLIKTYDVGEYNYTTPASALYTMIAIGGGGGGGGMWGGSPGKLAGTGSSGGLVYLPYTFIPKDTVLSVKVGKGGAGVDDGMGGNGGDTLIKDNKNNITYALAGGGGGGAGWRLHFKGMYGGIGYDDNFIIGYPGGWANSFMWCKDCWPNNVIPSRKNVGTKFKDYKEIFKQTYSGFAGGGSSDISSAVKVSGRRLGNLLSSDHQNKANNFNLIPELTNYNGTFGFDFNILTPHPTNRALGTRKCKNFSNYQKYRRCKVYTNHFGAGGGGEGDYGDNWYFTAENGVQGFVAIKHRPLYAGTGGKAGKVIQIPYSELPSKTLLFPGKGGNGGSPSSNIYYSTTSFDCGLPSCGVSGYTNNSATAGKQGQSSYIKNGSEIMGGAGASKINPEVKESYSQILSSANMPVGDNGELSNVLTSQKTGNGGLGGLNTGEIANTTIHGMTQSVFRNNAEIGSFKNIYGAGSGGGGGTAKVNGTTLNFGSGGNGSSGLVFIQW